MTRFTQKEHNQALIHWTGQAADIPSSTIFILTRNRSGQEVTRSSFWRSKDYGLNWEDENDKFKIGGTENVLHSFVISPLDKKKVFFMESNHTSVKPLRFWVSHDEGENFKGLDLYITPFI
jgi:hypothetical protein